MDSKAKRQEDEMSWPQLTLRRIVVKLGTTLLTAGTSRLDLEVMASLVGQIARLHRDGREVIVVSSGAVAAGRHRLGNIRQLRNTPLRQVCAAVGQSILMDAYEQLFEWHSITIAQTLVTRADLQNRVSYLNARNTLLALLELGVVPIVNENDVVAVDELEGATFGDNDNLSALVANLVDADALVMLTDIDGLYSADPGVNPAARRISLVTRIDDAIEESAGRSRSRQARGGMMTKVQAARLATASGVAVVIASGHERDILTRLVDGEPSGTLFLPVTSKLESRKRWMLSGLSRRGALVVDEGAVAALRHEDRSLLPAGIKSAEGDFQRGDIVSIRDSSGSEIACGMVNYDAKDVIRMKGLRSSQIQAVLGYHYGDEVVHRNNLVVL